MTDNPTGARPALGSAIADPAPLGLAAFAGTTFMLSVINTNIVSGSVTAAVLGLALFYGGLAQLLAGMWEFLRDNTFGALAFSSFGGFWMSYWYLVEHVLPDLKASTTDVNHAVGLYLLVWTIFTAYMVIASIRVSGVVAAVFVFLALTFLALCLGAFNAWDDATKAGGWLGLVTAVVAWYGSLAGVANSTFGKAVFPTFPTARTGS